MHRRTFLQSLCILAAAAAIGHLPASSPAPAPYLANGWADASFLREGDVFTISGFFAVNPPSRDPARLQEFVVTGVCPERHGWYTRSA